MLLSALNKLGAPVNEDRLGEVEENGNARVGKIVLRCERQDSPSKDPIIVNMPKIQIPG